MDMILFEDRIKYDPWVKLALGIPFVLLVVLGILFAIDAYYSDIFPREPGKESGLAAVVFAASIVLVLAVYWFFLPRKISVFQKGIKITFGAFSWNIPFETLRSVRAARGIIVWYGYSCITSYGSQIEILRKKRMKIRVSPNRRDQFLEHADRAFAEWKRTHGII
ncbi:MAG: PH domain-containing protein [Candidatus Aminicenantales bacterium]